MKKVIPERPEIPTYAEVIKHDDFWTDIKDAAAFVKGLVMPKPKQKKKAP